MKKLSFFSLTLLCATLLVFSACKKDQVEELATQPVDTVTLGDASYYTPNLEDLWTEVTGRSAWTTIPAGSVDMLNQAIASASPGGIIYLEAGLHTETERVTVNKPLKIIGADGAMLEIQSTDTVASLNPAIHVVNAEGTAIQNLEIKPYGDGAYTAIAFDHSPWSAVLSSSISDFPIGILLEEADKTAIINNVITGSSDLGILVNNGESTYVGNNEFAECNTGIWACDKWGTIDGNFYHDNLSNSVFLCKYNVIFESTLPGNAQPIGADFTCTGWKIRNNNFVDNRRAVNLRDNSNLNLVEDNNTYSGNWDYDVIIPPDQDIPNFLFIPSAKNNTLYLPQDVIYKDCGEGNTIIGGTQVDYTQDPC